MKAFQRRQNNRFICVDGLGNDTRFRAKFPARSLALFTELHSVSVQMSASLQAQITSGGSAGDAVHAKDASVHTMVTVCHRIHETATLIPEATGLFAEATSHSETDILAMAHNYVRDSEPLEAEFVAWGMAEDFRGTLTASITDYEAQAPLAVDGNRGHVLSTAQLNVLTKRGIVLVNQLGVVARNVLTDPEDLRTWEVAANLEDAPHHAKTETPAA